MTTMDDASWTAFLDTLTPGMRRRYQALMARVSYIINSDRTITMEDVMHLEDNDANQQRQIRADEVRQDDTDARLDADETEMHAIADRVTELEHPR